MLALATAVVAVQGAYLFQPGHGLTDKTGQTKTVADLILECQQTGPWMKIVEKAYTWSSLEPSQNVYTVNQIVDDAALCGSQTPRMYLRVMILHKYTSFPTYMDGTPPNEDGPHTAWIGGVDSNIKLDQNSTRIRLEKLYEKVIVELRKTPNAVKGFYGFVLQETTIGDGGTSSYFGTDGPNLTPTQIARRDKWFDNLRIFHDWLAADLETGLNNFAAAAPVGRLFWQMINTPDDEIDLLIAQRPIGMGLCGPDTFPREPSNGSSTATTVLFRSYETMRQWRWAMPLSLHVYAGNYRHDRPHQHAAMIPGVVPFWKAGDTSAINGYNNLDAGDGLFNFLGCAGDIGTPPVTASEDGTRDDNMDVHNVIWSTAEGDLKKFDGYDVNGDLEKNANGTYIEAGETFLGSNVSMPFGHYGWSKAKTEMMANNGKFVDNATGGLNTSRPSGVP